MSTQVANDLTDVQKQIRVLERGHKDLFSAIFVEKTLSRYEGITLIIRSGQELQALYRREKALAKLKQRR